MPTRALADAALGAPTGPGVYFFLSDERDLLYVGKASNLRRRLGNHARDQQRPPPGRRGVLLDAVAFVHWETTADEEEAFAREADLIVLLRPSLNASHSDQDLNSYVHIDDGTFELSADIDGPGRAYGSFPHLAKGAYSHTATRTKAGYTALLRLVWAAQGGEAAARIPGRIAGDSPPSRHRTPVAPALQAPLHDYLNGRSVRLIPTLQRAIAVPDFMRPGLDRDAVSARELFELSTRRLRAVRLRHGRPPGPVAGDVLTDMLASELRAAIGDFRAPAAPEPAGPLGRRATRVRQLRKTIAGR